MILRHASPEERQAWQEHEGVWIDMRNAEVMVAEKDGRVIGFLCGHLIWHVDHLVMLEGSRMEKSRASLMLYRKFEQFIKNPLTNRYGARWMLCFTRRGAVRGWAHRLGWTRCFERCATYTKKF